MGKNKALHKAHSTQKHVNKEDRQSASNQRRIKSSHEERFFATDEHYDVVKDCERPRKKPGKTLSKPPSSLSTTEPSEDTTQVSPNWKKPKRARTSQRGNVRKKKRRIWRKTKCPIMGMPLVKVGEPSSLIALDEGERPVVYIDRDVYEAPTMSAMHLPQQVVQALNQKARMHHYID